MNFDYQTIKGLQPEDKRIEIFDEHTKGLGLRVTKAGTKTFFYRYRYFGKTRRYTLGQFPGLSLADARKKVNKLKVKVNEGIDPQAKKREKKQWEDPQLFSELAEVFKKKYLPTLRESTRKEYERIIDKELIPALGKVPISEISKNQVISLLDKKAYTDKAPTMANRIRARLSRIFTFGMERGLTEKNPVQHTSKYKEGETKRDRYYSKEEIKNLWQFFEEWGEPAGSVLKMLLICGQRKTETMHMRWDKIRGDVWTIPGGLAKNKQPHDVPLSEMAIQILKKMEAISGDSEYVFESPKKENVPINSLSRVRQAIQNDKDVKVPDFTPHDLRRTFATYCAKLGVDRTVLGKILNHKGLSGDSQVTAIYDRHSYLDEKREALNKWSHKLQQIIDGT